MEAVLGALLAGVFALAGGWLGSRLKSGEIKAQGLYDRQAEAMARVSAALRDLYRAALDYVSHCQGQDAAGVEKTDTFRSEQVKFIKIYDDHRIYFGWEMKKKIDDAERAIKKIASQFRIERQMHGRFTDGYEQLQAGVANALNEIDAQFGLMLGMKPGEVDEKAGLRPPDQLAPSTTSTQAATTNEQVECATGPFARPGAPSDSAREAKEGERSSPSGSASE